TPSSGAITMTSCPSSVNRSTAWRSRVTTPSTDGRKVSVTIAIFTGPGSLPGDGRHDQLALDAVGVVHGDLDDLGEVLLRQQVRLQAQGQQRGVHGVVVVVVLLHAGVVHAGDGDLVAEIRRDLLHLLRQLLDRELLGELVVDPELAAIGGVLAGDLDAAHRVLDVEVAAGLGAVAVDGEVVADGRLDDEAVQGGAEHGVVVETVHQARVQAGLVRQIGKASRRGGEV